MAFTKTQLILIGIGVLLVLFVILIFMGVIPGLRSTETPDISGEITIWGVADEKSVIEETLIAQYNAIHPNVAVTYRQMNEATYEEDLINALASGRGPDAYMIKNNWVLGHADKLVPLTPAQYPLSSLQADFPNVVVQDFSLTTSTVYGFPLFIDTLALFYNKDLFDNAGIASPPTTWEQIEAIVPRLRSVDATQKIQQAAIALGGSAKSISHPADIVSLLMLQHNTPMNTTDGIGARFADDGEDAFKQYLNFANPASELYTWNDSMGSDIEAFAKGKVAMMLGYRSDIKRIEEKNPFFRFGIAPAPQVAGSQLNTTYASYWGLVVANTSENAGIAWDFIGSTMLNPDIAGMYAETAGRTPALRSLIGEETENINTGFLARQALSAKSWRQVDGAVVDGLFSQMIEAVLTGKMPPREAAKTAEEAINELIRRKTRVQQ